MFALIAGFFKLSFLLIIVLILIFKICEKFNHYQLKMKKQVWEKYRSGLIKECEINLQADPGDEKAADLYKRLQCHYLINCMYDYILYLQEKHGGWQVCPSCKFPAPKDMFVCPYCEYVTPEGLERGRAISEWANS